MFGVRTCNWMISKGREGDRVLNGVGGGGGRGSGVAGSGGKVLDHRTPGPVIPHQGAGKGSSLSGPEWNGGHIKYTS